jgi:hypothetical protein
MVDPLRPKASLDPPYRVCGYLGSRKRTPLSSSSLLLFIYFPCLIKKIRTLLELL